MSAKIPRILIIDDETHVRMIMKAYLAPYDAEVIDTRDGIRALDIMKEKDIDLVILDYAMPLMSGQEVLDLMMQDPRLENIPVIIYTAGGFSKEIEAWLKTTSKIFVKKTNLGDELIPAVESLLGSSLRISDENTGS